ncbi:MAG: CBS domain-containing protein [Acidimicrobiales bacterium]
MYGFEDVYDYVDGKVDWMATAWRVEGSEGPFLGQDLGDVATCEATASVADARQALAGTGDDGAVVVLRGLAVGWVDGDGLAGEPADRPVTEVMDLVPSTVRPSVTVASIAAKGGGRPLVTSSDGRLLGRAAVDPAESENGGRDPSGELHKVIAALESRFGDREPSEEELRALLREMLEGEGRSPAEAERFLDTMDTGDHGSEITAE